MTLSQLFKWNIWPLYSMYAVKTKFILKDKLFTLDAEQPRPCFIILEVLEHPQRGSGQSSSPTDKYAGRKSLLGRYETGAVSDWTPNM